jgi:hypothetical protein
MLKRPTTIAVLLVVTAFGLTQVGLHSTPANPHSEAWLSAWRNGHALYDLDNGLFSTAGACESCHGADPDGIASVTLEGEDVNVVDAWRASIMANSARDPYWRAKMRQEMANAPAHADETGHFCTKCHAPLGRHAHEVLELEHYTFDYLLHDSVGLDGVSCVACHQLAPNTGAVVHTGELVYEQDRIAYGPFESPLASPMALFSGYNPVYSEHISEAAVCAGCHSLVTQTIDLEGNFTGSDFVEQATWHEWLNSIYADDQLNITCQSCHMPSLGKQPVVIAAGYETPGRMDFSKHTFAGANAYMLEIMRDHRDTLGISASDEDFAAAITATLQSLQLESLELETVFIHRDADTVRFEVVLENLVGHKFPSGYPARRLWLSAELSDPLTGEVLFHSGSFDEEGRIANENTQFEPHYEVITQQSQVQIYEMVMADVEGQPTTLLERAAGYLKDNRLVPKGFSSMHAVYDTTQLAGAVLNDLNFNRDDFGNEGTGIDRIRYHIATEGEDGELLLTVKAWYMAVPPKWTDVLFELDDPLVNHFAEMHAGANKLPVQVAESSATAPLYVGLFEPQKPRSSLRSTLDQRVFVNAAESGELFLFGLNGRMVEQRAIVPGHQMLQMNLLPGAYAMVLVTPNERISHKMVVIR